ncbi:hypothetical protein B0T26DRAFT_346521 [Lasiosphaeria miniovina]|uniref:Kelch repeat-containing protein n=1 Tax=Lasiosphaeria miniovina TaxID=1954250 RepID=A0AA40ABF4_9PEZI|nr:uncharacterized protein B0T26DRAFT_346521 [Lasiosphaeria miniovina]KAK0712860.1 hypothetical protein B0T26DRAFT_346521 [Lasiosphaeria miniovina]
MASTWLVVLGLAFWAAIAAALPDVPSVANFMRKATANAVVLGDFVYVDGGEMSQKVDGKVATFKDRDGSVIFSVQVNSTVSIDMSKSWTSDSVAMRTIKKQGPLKTNMQAWADRSANVFYSWGGKWIRGFNMTETTLWKFAADGSGGGTWSVAPAANPSLLNTLHPGEFAAVAATSDSAFVMGGVASGWTEQFRAITQTLPGMATYNLSTRVWQNGTTNFSPFDRIAGASAEFVPSFGPNGLIFAFGGFAPPADDPNPDFGTSPNFDLQNLTFFDPQTKKTYSQVTTGDVPPYPRSEFCTAGFSDPSGRHEIFMFGGTNRRDKFAYNDSYVLSLPGFVWTKLPDSPDGVRTTQACVVVGNRQVLSIGGVDGFGKGYNDVDPAPQGLLLFDMVDQKWSHSYNASAPAYESPKAIQDLYSAG